MSVPETSDGSTVPDHARIPGTSSARGYRWEDAKPGNFLNLRHGAYSPRIIESLAGELIERVLQDRPELRSFPFALGAWARSEVRVALLHLFVDEKNIVDDSGGPRERLLKEIRAEERRAAEERRNLGLDPTGWARLTKDAADIAKSTFDLEKLRADGQKVRVAAEARFERERAERERQSAEQPAAIAEESADA